MELVGKYMSQKCLITRKDPGWEKQYKNAITDELDTLVLDNHKPSVEYGGGTYLDGFYKNNHMAIRFPGATRGTIQFNKEGIITAIWLYNDDFTQSVQCYKPEAYEAVKKYVGSKLIFV